MTDSERARNRETPARAAALIAEFIARQDAWQKQTADLARGRERVCDAAQREATHVVVRTRADIERTLADARRHLLMLAAQVRAVDEPRPSQPSNDAPTTSASSIDPAFVEQVRRGLDQALTEAQSDLDRWPNFTEFFDEEATAAQEPKPDAADPSGSESVPGDRRAAPAHTASLFESATAPQRTVLTYGEKIRRRRAVTVGIVVSAFVVVALSIVGWWVAVGARRSTAGTPIKPNSMQPSAIKAPATPPAADQPIVRNRVPMDRRAWLWLVVEARRAAWIEVTSDGRTEPPRVLQAGEGRRILANENISITAADAGAITLALNGVPLAALGHDGQRATRRFTLEDAEKFGASPATSRSGSATMAGVEVTHAPSPVRSGNPELDILTSSQRWLDGYYRGDQHTMASVSAPDTRIVDLRDLKDRMPKGVLQVNRSFEELQFEQHGSEATLVGRMTEEADVHGVPALAVAIVSERWRHEVDRWRLTEARIVNAPR